MTRTTKGRPTKPTDKWRKVKGTPTKRKVRRIKKGTLT